jgi:hypothetical protein
MAGKTPWGDIVSKGGRKPVPGSSTPRPLPYKTGSAPEAATMPAKRGSEYRLNALKKRMK